MKVRYRVRDRYHKKRVIDSYGWIVESGIIYKGWNIGMRGGIWGESAKIKIYL